MQSQSFFCLKAFKMSRMLKEFVESADKKLLQRIRKSISARLASLEMADRVMSASEKFEFRSKSYNESLELLLSEDWSQHFSHCSDEVADFYVYLHGSPKNKRTYSPLGVRSFAAPIYAGMGQGGRAFSFARSPAHLEELCRLTDQGYCKEEIVHVVRCGLSERQARELESKLILFFGIRNFKAKGDKRHASFNGARTLLNAKYEAVSEKYLELR